MATTELPQIMAPGGEAETSAGERLRILHIVDHARNVGNGIVNIAVDLACAQAQAGHRVGVASGGGDYESVLAGHGVTHHALVREDSPAGRARLVARLAALVRRERPEVVNAHRPYATVAARLARPLAGYAVLATDHNEFESKGRVLRAADMIIAVSDGAAGALAAGGIDRSRIRVVQNGPLFGARQTLVAGTPARELHHPAIVTVAGLVARKGVHELLAAFDAVAAAHPEVHLYLVGDGPERAALATRAAGAPWAQRLHIEGFQPDPGAYLRGADIFVLPSHKDPFPLAALEARAAGCAMVVSDADGLPEAVDGGAAGMIVPARDTGALADALEELLGSAQRLADARRRAAAGTDRFSAARMARDTDAVYREALTSRRRQR